MGWLEWLARASIVLFVVFAAAGYATAGTALFALIFTLFLIVFAVVLYSVHVSIESDE